MQFNAILLVLYRLVEVLLMMTELYVGTSSARDKKFFIWNFMEELCDMYDTATEKQSTTVFKIRDFKSTKLPIFTLGEPLIFQMLKEYEQDKGFIRIQGDTVTVTSKGLLKAKEARHDWD
ncbi:MAG: hypothetical protein WBN72_10510 [Nitrososphaeraceae archaeon]